jgi:thiamine pyrophosphokinase
LPTAKDRSDLWFALGLARQIAHSEKGRESTRKLEIVALGVRGGRPDHHLAMLLDCSDFVTRARGRIALSVRGPDADYHWVTPGRLAFRGLGRVFSIFSIGGVAQGVSLSGAEYPLKQARLSPSSHGLSNRARRGICRLSVGKGCVLVILPVKF